MTERCSPLLAAFQGHEAEALAALRAARLPERLCHWRARVDGAPDTGSAEASAVSPSRLRGAVPGPAHSEFRDLLDQIPAAVVVGVGGRFVYAHPALLDLLGQQSGSAFFATRREDYLDAAGLTQVAEALGRLARGEVVAPFDVTVRRADGRSARLEVLLRTLEWEGEPAALAVAHDLTERERLRARLHDADRLAAVGTLAAGVAHEINNPLAYVMLNLEYMMRELPRQRDDPAFRKKLDDHLEDARHGARRVASIMQELHGFAERETGKVERVRVRDAVQAAIAISGPQVHPRARLIAELADVGVVLGNATQLEQVIVNLLVNAAQAIGAGARDLNTVGVHLERAGEAAVIEVSDSGAGIEPAQLAHVFDPFFTTKAASVGTGIGLTLSHRIVTAMGGTINVSSQVGVGTTFRVALPLVAEVAPERAAAPARGGAPTRRARVLVIDDEPLVAQMLSRVLEEQHDVSLAVGGEEALLVIEAAPGFDVIFCDLLMPGMDGMHLYEVLLERDRDLASRMVFMSAGAFTARAAHFLALVPNRRIAKPFDLAEVERIVAEVVTTR